MSKILLHTCCGICAGHCVPTLLEMGHEVTMFYSNANIAPHKEFLKRLEAVEILAKHFNVDIIVDEPNHQDWVEKVARGFEQEKERGARCPRCFNYSLFRTAQKMDALNFDLFTTTLTVSPHKSSKLIFEIGKNIDANHFLEIDFKKKDGFKHSNEVARLLNLYRQCYCGCPYSLRDSLAMRKEKDEIK